MENAVADLPTPDVTSQRPRKRMRKGTRSCTECSSTCAGCSARGSECVDQTKDVHHVGTVDHRTRPRSLVSPVSSGLRAQASPGIPSRQGGPLVDRARLPEGESSDIETSFIRRPPLVSALDNAEDGSSLTASSPSSAPDLVRPAARAADVCQALRSALPIYDDITATLLRNGGWWDSFRQKTRAISQAEPVEPLLSFAAHAYTSASPAEVAILAVAYARALGRSHRLFAVVDSLIISDFALAATLDGMECLILLAKTYTDIGQPRRAWLTWRKGLAIAQLMSLHRVRPDAPAIRQRIWWAIYHGDRFTSLLLGLPHGFNDAYFDTSTSNAIAPGPPEVWLPQFIHQCAVMAGEVITCILPSPKPSFAKAMALDEQMDAISTSAPVGWWDIPTDLPDSSTELGHLTERLLVHFFFFHIRMYIHLPFLKSSLPSSSYNVSRLACTDAARHMLKRYLVLRTELNGGALFDCKTSDFVAFTAAVVLLMGRSSSLENSSVPICEDLQLSTDAERIFRRLEKENSCKIAAQCANVLTMLSSLTGDAGAQQEIPIPYFGTVVRRRVAESPQAGYDVHDTNAFFQPTPSNSTVVSTFDAQSAWASGYGIEYMGYSVQDLEMDDMWGGGGGIEDNLGLPLGLDAASLDIDQDWSLFAPSLRL